MVSMYLTVSHCHIYIACDLSVLMYAENKSGQIFQKIRGLRGFKMQ